MATLLLIVIYIAFIGLGIPDPLFGTAWPAIYQEFDLPISVANAVTILTSGCTTLSSLFSARIINRFGTAKVTMFSTVLTAVALLGSSFSGNIVWLCLLAMPLGLGAGTIDAALNNYVALHYNATHMSFLHCFYGVGISISPYLMAIALNNENNWRSGYLLAFFVQLAIALVTIVSLPLWKKAHPDHTASGGEETSPRTLRLIDLFRLPGLKSTWLMFVASCGIEASCSTWGSTFLVNAKGMDVDAAAELVMFYFIGMTLGRFLSGVLASKLSSWQLIRIGLGILCGAVLLLLLPLGPVWAGIGLFLVGLGNGPIFPNLTHLTPKNFGEDVSQSIIGSQMAVASAALMLMPPIFGFCAQFLGTEFFPIYLLLLFVMLIGGTIALIKTMKQQNRYHA